MRDKKTYLIAKKIGLESQIFLFTDIKPENL